jgi:flagella basal body P-ring formation protein FlgA
MMHLIRPMLLLLAAALLLFVAESVRSDTLRIHDVAGADGPDILLKHVAEMEGDHVAGFADVVVGRFIADETRVDLKTATILEAIRDEGAKLGLLDLSGFTKVVVHRTFSDAARPEEDDASEPTQPMANVESLTRGEPVTVYTPTTVKALIEQTIAKRMGLGLPSLKITFNERDGGLLGESAVAGRYEVQPMAEPTLGAVTFKVTGYRGTTPTDEGQTISARVQQRVIAVVAAEKIDRGEMITRRQVRLREVLIDDITQTYLGETSLVTGQVADTTIRPGELVTAGSVKLPIAVTRRQRVSVELNAGGIRITFNGVAQGEGAVGETIEVENAKTGQRFNAIIVARGKVVAGEAIASKKEDAS